ncbi:dCTP deaminase [Blastochloris tepida]|uniref:dCTP deaminase n=1 Tax=Blastochloris tepida TaxID=2233851 RepID=A0A348FZB7_9HYPH|nr:deoxycytidine triphosphate deaminase [Blastochloris tepida]BBF92650.1 dCTP deaminase [Blastochloris tepida]
MILAAQDIRERGIITPFHERTRCDGMTFGLGPAGYDVRLCNGVTLAHDSPVVLGATFEYFKMPADVLAYVKDKSTWARRGLFVQNTVIEPGWRGFLTLELTYHGRDMLHVPAGTPIAQIIFHLLTRPTDSPYSGKYQDQKPGPQPAILETDDGVKIEHAPGGPNP